MIFTPGPEPHELTGEGPADPKLGKMNQTFIEKHRPEYQTAIRSSYWKKLKALKLKMTGGRCEACGCPSMRPELHHRHYKTLGKEQPGDVMLVCLGCHDRMDREREAQGKRNFNSAITDSHLRAIETFVRKKHGLEPHEIDPFEYEEEFEEWREKRAECERWDD